MHVERFEARVDPRAVEDLRDRLAATRWPDEPDSVEWAYGANLGYMRALVAYWQNDFDWDALERRLNAFPAYRAHVDGIGIHFLHVRGCGRNPLPLVVTHGWPSSYLEMLDLVPMLADPERFGASPHDSFDVVVPSLPGYGFSDRPTANGAVRPKIPDLWVALMQGLGYERFGAHGGDIGASVTNMLGRRHAQRLIGIHVTAVAPPNLGPSARPLSECERAYVAYQNDWKEAEGAYSHIQGTRPQTLAYGLNDSPAGLAAWIVEKFRAWSDCHGDIDRHFNKDALLSNVSLYWLTETINSSIRLYYDARHNPSPPLADRIAVPAGITLTTEPVDRAPREWADRSYADIRRFTELDRGGHFLASEEPAILAGELREFFRPLRATA
jgi:pimeloyl-ACP methyl ester carboxylesterase